MNYSDYKYIVIGAGFFGSVIAERIATELKEKVLVIDSRDHIGGNAYSEIDSKTGIEFHKYGTHIFHTSSKKVWDYISKFMELNGYYHQVLTTHNDQVFQMPINLETINSFYKKNFTPSGAKEFIKNEAKKENITDPQNLEEKAISQIGRPLYEAFIKGYTQKQWNKDPKDLPASIINRLPIRFNYNETYFHKARYQGIPREGYTKIFENLLSSDLIDLKLSTDFFDIKDQISEDQTLIYSGPVDRFFDYKHGHLDWRSIELEMKYFKESDYQGTSVMNYADESVEYTRVHEPMHLHPERNYENKESLVFFEYPKSEGDPYYPIEDEKNKKIFKIYQEEASKLDNVIIGGRLGNYKYYDMDQVIGQALSTFEKYLSKN